MILERKSFKPRRLAGLTAYVFARVAYEICGGLRLSAFLAAYGGLRVTTAAWGATSQIPEIAHVSYRR